MALSLLFLSKYTFFTVLDIHSNFNGGSRSHYPTRFSCSTTMKVSFFYEYKNDNNDRRPCSIVKKKEESDN